MNTSYGELDAEVKKFLIEVDEYLDESSTNDDIVGRLDEFKTIQTSSRDKHHWGDTFEKVIKIEDRYIKLSVNRDQSIFDLGWMLNLNSVRFVEPHVEMIEVTSYY